MSWKCQSCNNKLKGNEKVCPNCGTTVVYKCSKCGTELEDGKYKKCARCKTKTKETIKKVGAGVAAGAVVVGTVAGAVVKNVIKKD